MKFKDLFEKDGSVNWELIKRTPQFAALAATEQSMKWHQEGDVMTHTRLVAKNMEALCEGCRFKGEERLLLMSAALCHDLGKATTTVFDEEKGDYTTKNHGEEGARIVRSLFFEEDFVLRERVCNLVRNHMTLHHIFDNGNDDSVNRNLIRLSLSANSLFEHMLLWKADTFGSINEVETPAEAEYKYSRIFSKAVRLGILNGRYDAGLTPTETYSMITASPQYRNKTYESANKGIGQRLVMLIGMAGSGKSTFAANDPLLGDDYVVLSRDTIRSEMGLKGEKPQGDREQEEAVTRLFTERLDEAFREHDTVVVDNMNLRRRYREDVVHKARVMGMKVVYVFIDTPLELCRKRREGMIDEDVISRMPGALSFPEYYEFDEAVVVETRKRDNSDGLGEYAVRKLVLDKEYGDYTEIGTTYING